MKKRIIIMALLISLCISGTVFAMDFEKPISTDLINYIDLGVQEAEFKFFKGEVKSLTNEGDLITILVENIDKGENTSFDEIIFNVSEDTIVLSHNTKELVNNSGIKEGMEVTIYYPKNAPMTMSLPPMMNASVLILEDTENKSLVKVSKFDEDFISMDNDIKINILEDTVITNQLGDKLTEEELSDKDLIVFYGETMTMSLPAQTNAKRIVAIEREVSVLDQVVINGEDLFLKNEIYKSGKYTMIPLREITEKLGYEVKWNQENYLAELTKGVQYITVKPNEDLYSFARMIVKLGKTSELKDGTTYVPVEFINKVLNLDYNISQNGILSIY